MTSNLGSEEMEKNGIGFISKDSKQNDEDLVAIKKFFTPEFRNRLDGVIRFNKLSKDILVIPLSASLSMN